VNAGPTIRPATADDAEAISEIYAPEVTDGFATFEYEVLAVDEFVRRIESRPRLPWLVAEQDGDVTGFAYASRHRARAAYQWATECSVYVGADYRGRGIGRGLLEALIPSVRDLGYVTMYSGIVPPNPGSVALHQAVGFELIGTYRNVGYKRGKWRDVEWYELLLTDPAPLDPATPAEWSGQLR
jgi:L-amino acid N-acyltransferase YncA